MLKLPALAPLSLALAALLLAGCTTPIGVDRVSTRQAYEQVDANAMRSGKPSAKTVALLHRYDLDRLAASQPDEAVRRLHQHALVTGERDLLFALAELSYVAADRIHRSVEPEDHRDAREYYLGSAIYAYLYLFGEGKEAPPGPFQREFREACDFYNYSLGLALTEPGSKPTAIQLAGGRRQLPVGAIALCVKDTPLVARTNEFQKILLADQFRVRGLSVRNREGGIGTPLICVGPLNTEFQMRQCAPATVFLRGPGSLTEVVAGTNACSLEFYANFSASVVTINGAAVPLEIDLTTYRAYALNQSAIWGFDLANFLAPSKQVRSQLILNQPYSPGRIPVVFVHGTFSSPVTWAEMVNSLMADPVLREHYQLWTFIYSTGNPLPVSAAELRDALTATVQKLDPAGKDPALRQMVVIGHSQGGLLAKLTAVETGDRLWRVLSTNSVDQLNIPQAQRDRLRHLIFIEPLPFVQRVVFISTPHRGSYLASSFIRKWARRLVTLPATMIAGGQKALKLIQGSAADKFLRGKMPTSLDGMSPQNPALLTLANIPVASGVKAHSIISIKGADQPPKGGDGIVKYTSAHQDYTDSEFIVHHSHTCLDEPATIEEVRRILHEHLTQLPSGVLTGALAPTAAQK